MWKSFLSLLALECAVIMNPTVGSCQMCCESENIKACRFLPTCSGYDITPSTPSKPDNDSDSE